MRYCRYLIIIGLTFLLAACGSTTINGFPRSRVSRNANWGVLPFANHTSMPLAGDRVAAMTRGLLLSYGVRHITIYPVKNRCNNLVTCQNQKPSSYAIKTWVRKNKIRYLVTGSVNEWRYKVGLDGEPAANVTLQVTDATTGRILWNAVGSKTGGSRSGLSTIGQQLITNMLGTLSIY